jgi:hypothetical protein|tara:strand:+ start:471 stop:947 length:477 start_codon:yes stop_codon:yes gene_type:complete
MRADIREIYEKTIDQALPEQKRIKEQEKFRKKYNVPRKDIAKADAQIRGLTKPKAQRAFYVRGDTKNKLQHYLEQKIYVDGHYSAKDLEVYAKIIGVVDKQETKHTFDLSAEDHARIAEEGTRRAKELEGKLALPTSGVGSVQAELSILPGKLRQDSK